MTFGHFMGQSGIVLAACHCHCSGTSQSTNAAETLGRNRNGIVNETENDATNSVLRLGYRRGRQHQFACRFQNEKCSKLGSKKKHFGSLFFCLGFAFSGVSFLPACDSNFNSDLALAVDVDVVVVVDGHIDRLGPALELHLSAVNIF